MIFVSSSLAGGTNNMITHSFIIVALIFGILFGWFVRGHEIELDCLHMQEFRVEQRGYLCFEQSYKKTIIDYTKKEKRK